MINIPHMKRSNKIQSASSRGVKAELREGGVSNDVNCPRSHSELLYFSHVCAHTHTHTHTWAAISLKHSDRYWQPASLRVWSFQIIFMCDFKDQRRGGCEVLPRRKPKSSHLSLMNLRATPGRSPVIAVSQPLWAENARYTAVFNSSAQCLGFYSVPSSLRPLPKSMEYKNKIKLHRHFLKLTSVSWAAVKDMVRDICGSACRGQPGCWFRGQEKTTSTRH